MLILNYFVIKIFFDILNAKHIVIKCVTTPIIAAYLISPTQYHEIKKPDKDLIVIIIAIIEPLKNISDEPIPEKAHPNQLNKP